jgi:hypothetical protein
LILSLMPSGIRRTYLSCGWRGSFVMTAISHHLPLDARMAFSHS